MCIYQIITIHLKKEAVDWRETIYKNQQSDESINEKLSMFAQNVEEYLEQMMKELQQQSSEDEKQREDSNTFLKNISNDINLFFNRLIYSLNIAKNSINDQSNSYDITQYTKSASKGSAQDKEQLQMKQIDQLYKAQQQKLDNKPKKPVSSFFLFYQQKSKDLAQQHGQVVGARVAQIVADTWNKLTQKQKEPYVERAHADKERYKEEMSNYIQQHSAQIDQIKKLKRMKNNKIRQLSRKKDKEGQIDDGQDSQVINMKIKGISQRQMKAAQRKNYSHRPKAPVSSFFLFYQDQAKNIATKHGQTVGSRLARLASTIWLSMKPQQKQKYEQAAKIERERYHQEMLQYKIDYPNEIQNRRKKISNNMKRFMKTQTESQKESSSESDSDDSLGQASGSNQNSHSSHSSNSYSSSESQQNKETSGSIVKSKKKEKDDPMPHKPKGPICSFFQYYHSNLKEFMKKQPEENQKDAGFQLVKKASLKWKALTEKQKERYHQLAKVDRERYQKDMQHFKITYPQQYEALKIFNKNKQLKNKKKREAKQGLKEIEIDDQIIM